jgi:hypothetical protein
MDVRMSFGELAIASGIRLHYVRTLETAANSALGRTRGRKWLVAGDLVD